MTDIVDRLRSSAPLPICPYDRRSPEYWTTPDDVPCKFCGGLPDGPDKCTGADMRIMSEAADEIDKHRALIETLVKALEEASEIIENHTPYDATKALAAIAAAKEIAA